MKGKSSFLTECKKSFGILLGIFVYCVGLNLFAVPHDIYCGGLFGFCQLLRTIIINQFNLQVNFDFASLIYYLINIPILIYAWFKISKPFLVRTIFCLTVMTPVLALIPVHALLPEDRLASCIIGGILTGGGVGLYMRMGASGGGTDIVGLILVKSNKGKSIGSVTLAINLVLYACCLYLFDIDVVIYSIIFSAIFGVALDKVYTQNINVELKIITRLQDDTLENAIIKDLCRGVTVINSTGAYTHDASRILYVVLSKYEIPHLRAIVKKYDPHAFIVESGSVSVYGNYLKKLSD